MGKNSLWKAEHVEPRERMSLWFARSDNFSALWCRTVSKSCICFQSLVIKYIIEGELFDLFFISHCISYIRGQGGGSKGSCFYYITFSGKKVIKTRGKGKSILLLGFSQQLFSFGQR